MKKIFITIFVILTSFSPSLLLAQSESVYIKNLNSDITVNKQAEVYITETITYQFNSSRHGMYREIPKKYVLKNGNTQNLDIEVLSVKYTQSGSENSITKYTREDDSEYVRIKIGDPNITIRGEYVYEINYKINYLIESYSNLDKLYLNIIGGTWVEPIYNVSAQIHMPANITEKFCYTGKENSSESDCTIESIDDTTLSLNSEKKFLPGEQLTIAVSMPAESVQNLNSQKESFNESLSSDDRIMLISKIVSLIIFIMVFISLGLIFILYISPPSTRSKRRQRKRIVKAESIKFSFKNSIIKSQFNIPQGWYVLKAQALLRPTLSSVAITAQIIQLAVLGYIKIVKDSEHTSVISTGKPLDGLDQYLKSFYEDLMFRQEECVLYATHEYRKTIPLVTPGISGAAYLKMKSNFYKLKKQLNKENILIYNKIEGKSNPKSLGFAIFAFLGFFIWIYIMMSQSRQIWFVLFSFGLLVVFPFFLSIFSHEKSEKTELGRNIENQLKGLFLYIDTAEKHRIDFHNDPQKYKGTFEQLFPYAILFGLSDKWVGMFDIQNFDWINTTGGSNMDFSNISTSIHSSYARHGGRSSSGSSGGSSSGSSGGGGGGGGGGSW